MRGFYEKDKWTCEIAGRKVSNSNFSRESTRRKNNRPEGPNQKFWSNFFKSLPPEAKVLFGLLEALRMDRFRFFFVLSFCPSCVLRVTPAGFPHGAASFFSDARAEQGSCRTPDEHWTGRAWSLYVRSISKRAFKPILPTPRPPAANFWKSLIKTINFY